MEQTDEKDPRSGSGDDKKCPRPRVTEISVTDDGSGSSYSSSPTSTSRSASGASPVEEDVITPVVEREKGKGDRDGDVRSAADGAAAGTASSGRLG